MDSKYDSLTHLFFFQHLHDFAVASYGKVHFDINRSQGRTDGCSFHRELSVFYAHLP